jgi:hypothetical protein
MSASAVRYADQLVAQERAACAELVRAVAKIESEVGATWEREAKAGGADAVHLRRCEAIGYAHTSFAKRLEELALELEARGSVGQGVANG